MGGRDRHPADADVPDRAAGRLRARRPGDHPDPGQPEPGAQRPGGDRASGSATSSSTPAWASSARPPCRPSTNAVDSTSPGDATYIHTNQALTAAGQGPGRAGRQDQGRAGGGRVQRHPGPRRGRPDRRLPGRHHGRPAPGGQRADQVATARGSPAPRHAPGTAGRVSRP